MKLSPSVQLAQDRLREFKDQHEATMPELSKLLGVDAKKLKLLLKQKAGPNIFADVVMEKLGSSGYDNTVATLDALRNSNGKVMDTDIHKPATGLPAEARRKYKDIRLRLKLTPDQIIEKMNKAPTAQRKFKKGALSVALSPSGIKDMSEGYAKDIIDAIDYVENHADISGVRHQTKTTPTPDTSVSDESIKTKAMRMLDDYKALMRRNWNQLSIDLGHDKNYLNGVRNRFKHGKLSQTSALDLIEKLEAKLCADSSPEAQNNNHSNTDSSNQYDDVLPVPGGGAPSSEEIENVQQTAPEQPLEPSRLSPEDSEAEARLYFPSGKELHDAISEAARLRLEDELGIDIDDLKAIRPQLEMLIVARRNHIQAQVVIAPVEAL